MTLWALLAILGLSSAAPAVAAPDPTPAPAPASATAVSPLTVTARARPLTSAAETQALQTYVKDHAVVSRNDRLARWREPVCPHTSGEPEVFDAFITDRVKAVARQVGAAVDRSAKCRANVEIVFSAAPQALINEMYRRHPLVVGYHHQSDAKALLAFDQPIKSWYVTATRSTAAGAPGAIFAGVPASDAAVGDAVLDESWGPSPGGAAGTRMDNSLNSELANALIIVDQKQAAGFEVGEIADYIALLALSQPPTLAACGTLDSILDLFSPDCRADQKPHALTASDAAYLTALYKANLSLAKDLSESQIIDLMRQGHPR
jgi:hypothetical protein